MKKICFFSFNFRKNFEIQTFSRWLSNIRGTKYFWRESKNFFYKSITRMLSQQWNSLRVAQHGFTSKNSTHFTAGWAWAKFVPRMLSVQWNCFLVCSVCDNIDSSYAQHAHAIIFENYSKITNLNAISTIKNRNFEKNV